MYMYMHTHSILRTCTVGTRLCTHTCVSYSVHAGSVEVGANPTHGSPRSYFHYYVYTVHMFTACAELEQQVCVL